MTDKEMKNERSYLDFFKKEWFEATMRLKTSRYDLSRIAITVVETNYKTREENQ